MIGREMKRTMLRPPALLMPLLLLAGCAGPAGPCNIPAEPALPPAADECGAAALDRYLNAVPTADVKAAIASAAGDRLIRYVAPGQPVTQDFRSSRLNVEMGDDGRIARFRCG
jgi:hypothetical protein